MTPGLFPSLALLAGAAPATGACNTPTPSPTVSAAPPAMTHVVATATGAGGDVTSATLTLANGMCAASIAQTTQVVTMQVALQPLGVAANGNQAAWTSRAVAGGIALRQGDTSIARALRPAAGQLDVLAPDGAALLRVRVAPTGTKVTDRAGRVVASVTAIPDAGDAGDAGIDRLQVTREGLALGAITGTTDQTVAALLLAPGMPPALRAILGCDQLAASATETR